MLFASLHKIYASQLFFHSEKSSSKYDQQEKMTHNKDTYLLHVGKLNRQILPFVSCPLQSMLCLIKWDAEVKCYEYWHHTEHVIR